MSKSRSDLSEDGRATQAEQIQRLESDGFLLLSSFLDADTVAALSAVSRERLQSIRAALGTKEIGIGSAAGYDEIVQRSPGRWDVPITPQQFGMVDRDMPWWGLVSAILGENAEHSFSGVVSSDPGSPAQHWHTDSPHVAKEHLPAHAINVFVALHDVPLAMGPTEFARGSHVLSNHLSNPSLVLNELISNSLKYAFPNVSGYLRFHSRLKKNMMNQGCSCRFTIRTGYRYYFGRSTEFPFCTT